MFDCYTLMIANMTYPAMPMSTTPVHVSKTFFQPSAYSATPLRRVAEVALDSVLLHGAAADEIERIKHQLARRDGPVVCVERMQPGDSEVALERLMIERALSINTSPMSIG